MNAGKSRKPAGKVLAIEGSLQLEEVTQRELRALENMQRAAWQAHESAVTRAAEIARRIRLGAAIERGPLSFDAELRMARSRKAKASGDAD